MAGTTMLASPKAAGEAGDTPLPHRAVTSSAAATWGNGRMKQAQRGTEVGGEEWERRGVERRRITHGETRALVGQDSYALSCQLIHRNVVVLNRLQRKGPRKMGRATR
jgi:hypothetical protein